MMQALERKVPPPAVAALLGILMWAIAGGGPWLGVPREVRIVLALVFALLGVGFGFAGAISFRRAKTTLNPMKLEATSSLVRSGVYKLTRNPMYLGLLLILIAWAVLLQSAWTWLGPLALALYLNRFQIIPEERVLAEKFGAEYDAYRARVRRWL